ncbi:16076_t:CDS:2 [Gigaspora margarita]|uniref:16076_t:CDS:1 n=1 Tax=Gigaspora margarita TaxID=4874 RepID=A0ABN7V0F5_GIGMA|nr:16076_t:CDS:2 [Gigaspora margarita]
MTNTNFEETKARFNEQKALKKDQLVAAWLGLNIPKIIATIRNALEMPKYFGYKKASNQHLTEEELQYLNFLEDHFKETRDSKKALENQKCGTMDYGVEEVLKQAEYFGENHLKLPKPLVQSKIPSIVIDNGLDKSDQDMTKSYYLLNNKKKAENQEKKENERRAISYKEEERFKRQIRKRVIEDPTLKEIMKKLEDLESQQMELMHF